MECKSEDGVTHKIKLVILIDVLEDIKGGAERQVYELFKRVDNNRFEPILYVLHQEHCPSEIANLNIICRTLGLKRIYDFKGIREGFRFSNFLRSEKVNVVMTYHFASDIWGTIFTKLGGVKAIISNRRDAGFWRNKNHVKAYKFVNCWVSKIIVVAEAVKRMVVIEERVAADKVVTIYNGVDLSRFEVRSQKSEIRQKLGIKEDEKVIVSVGNFNNEVKGQKYLIEAMRLLLEDGRGKIKLLLVGDGVLRERCELLAASYGLKENILFLGKRQDVAELLNIVDVCVLPSLSEGLSNALLEYMASGKPVVATAVGGNVEVIKDGINGFLVPAKDPAALALAIDKLLGNETIALETGRNARVTVEQNFEISKQIGKIEEFVTNECSAFNQ